MTDNELVQNRSEIVLLYDAEDANPNGNPLSPANRPRIDPVTNQVIVTDVRLKRYLRDQLHEDGHGVYIADVETEEGEAPPREYLVQRVTEVESPEDIGPDFLDEFLSNAVDVRYFGATLPFSTDDGDIASALAEHVPQHLTGPVQFSPGRSLHPVRENENYDSLTSVIATGEHKEQGGFDLDDHRIVYGLIGFSGVVNENNGRKTNLTEADVQRLDTLTWRAVKNQANSRNKRGQHPRLYLRIEYQDSYHVGNLDRTLNLGNESETPEELTTVTDTAVDIGDLLARLEQEANRIETVHLAHDSLLTVQDDTTVIDHEDLADHIASRLDVSVHEIDVYEEYSETVPAE